MKPTLLFWLSTSLLASISSAAYLPHFGGKFVHPGALHSASDISRAKKHVQSKEEPWYRAYQHLANGTYAQPTWRPDFKTVIVRGEPDPSTNLTQNYPSAYRAAHSAYQLALRWLITDNATFADAAIANLDGWSSTLEDINGNADM